MPQITLDFTVDQLTRACVALGLELRLDRDATPAEVKKFLIGTLRGVVISTETRTAEKQLKPQGFNPQ